MCPHVEANCVMPSPGGGPFRRHDVKPGGSLFEWLNMNPAVRSLVSWMSTQTVVHFGHQRESWRRYNGQLRCCCADIRWSPDDVGTVDRILLTGTKSRAGRLRFAEAIDNDDRQKCSGVENDVEGDSGSQWRKVNG